MANILNNNFHNLKLKITNDEYWDLFLNKDDIQGYWTDTTDIQDQCLIAYIDVELQDCVDDKNLLSHPLYVWDSANTNITTLENIGYTGFDNGLLTFRKDRILNKDFIELYENSNYNIPQENKLQLHPVSGSTQVWEYPFEIQERAIKLNGGFYQGFFKTQCDEYQVLPSHLEQGDTWAFEFVLKKEEHEKESNKTLNDRYPNNKGLFFYLGTRAENKWVYLYNEEDKDACKTIDLSDYVEGGEIDVKTHGLENFFNMEIEMPVDYETLAMDDYLEFDWTGDGVDDINFCCPKDSQCGCGPHSKCEVFGDDYLDYGDVEDRETDYVAEETSIIDYVYQTKDEFIIGKNEEYIDTDNKYLMFNRTCTGYTTHNWEEGDSLRFVREKNTFNENLFLLMDRTCNGYTTDTISDLKKTYGEKYDVLKDLYHNAIAFRITDKGEIGYRYLVRDCDSESGYSIEEGYSNENIITDKLWQVVHIKMEGYYNTMKLKFYVNGNLVFISKELPKLNLRELDDIQSKQETVPYNISLGGGTQGLADVILPNYMIEPYRQYPLETYFGGTFIGWLKSFKFYNCNLEHLNILQNFKSEEQKLK